MKHFSQRLLRFGKNRHRLNPSRSEGQEQMFNDTSIFRSQIASILWRYFLRENLFSVKIRSKLIYICIWEFDKYLFLFISVQKPSELGHNLDSREKKIGVYFYKKFTIDTQIRVIRNQRTIIIKILGKSLTGSIYFLRKEKQNNRFLKVFGENRVYRDF